MCWNIPARSPTQLDICPCANAPKNIKTVTTLAAHPDWPHGPPSETAWTGLHLTQEPQRWTWSKALEYWLACFFSEAETTSKYPGVRATRTGQSGGVSLKIRLGRLTLPSASHKLRPWSRSYMDFVTSMYAQTLLLPVLLGGKQLSLTGQMNQMGSLRVGHSCWQLSTSFQPSLRDFGNYDSQIDIGLPYLYWPWWQLIQNNAICMVWVDWQAPQLAMHPITTTGCLFQWHNVHLHTTFTGQRAVRFDCHRFASLPVDWPCSLKQGWNNHATGVTNWYWRRPELSRQWLGRKSTMAIATFSYWPWCICFSHLHRLAEGGPCDCPGLACTNQAHLQHGLSQAMHKFIVFVHGLLGHNLCRRQKTFIRTARTKLCIGGASRSCRRRACLAVSPATGVYFPKPQ